MAFADKIKSAQPEICPVCRQLYTSGRAIREKAYAMNGGSLKLCQNCYHRCYADADNGRHLSSEDDPANPVVRFRPSEILEQDKIFKKERPAIGYEYRMSWLVPEQILHNAVIWFLVCILLRIFLRLGAGISYLETFEEQCPSRQLVRYFIAGGSLLGAVLYAKSFVQGILYGMGHTRKLVLLAAMLFMILTAVFCA